MNLADFAESMGTIEQAVRSEKSKSSLQEVAGLNSPYPAFIMASCLCKEQIPTEAGLLWDVVSLLMRPPILQHRFYVLPEPTPPPVCPWSLFNPRNAKHIPRGLLIPLGPVTAAKQPQPPLSAISPRLQTNLSCQELSC